MKWKSRTSALTSLQQTWHSRFVCLRWSGYSSGNKAFNFHPVSGVFCAQTHNITSHSTVPEDSSLTGATLTGRSTHFYLLPYRTTSPLPHTNNFTSGCLIYCKFPLSVEKNFFLPFLQVTVFNDKRKNIQACPELWLLTQSPTLAWKPNHTSVKVPISLISTPVAQQQWKLWMLNCEHQSVTLIPLESNFPHNWGQLQIAKTITRPRLNVFSFSHLSPNFRFLIIFTYNLWKDLLLLCNFGLQSVGPQVHP